MSSQMFLIWNSLLTLFSADVNQSPSTKFTAPFTTANLGSLVSQVQAQAYAPSTLFNLHFQWRSFLNFCRTYHFTHVPASAHTVASYTCYLSCKTSLYQHILNQFDAVRLYNGCTVDSLDSFEVSLTKHSLKRPLGTATHQKHPITPTILLKIRHHLDTILPFHLLSGVILHCLSSLSSANGTWQWLQPLPLTPAIILLTKTLSSPVWSISSHSLDENSLTQGRPPCHSASQHSQLHALSCGCPSTLLFACPGFTISTTVLPSCHLWPSPYQLCNLQHLPQNPHFNHWLWPSPLISSQLLLQWRYVCLPVGHSRAPHKATQWLAIENAFYVYLALPLETPSQVADVMAAGLFPKDCNWTV